MEEDSLSKQYLELVNDIGFVAKTPRRAKVIAAPSTASMFPVKVTP